MPDEKTPAPGIRVKLVYGAGDVPAGGPGWLESPASIRTRGASIPQCTLTDYGPCASIPASAQPGRPTGGLSDSIPTARPEPAPPSTFRTTYGSTSIYPCLRA